MMMRALVGNVMGWPVASALACFGLFCFYGGLRSPEPPAPEGTTVWEAAEPVRPGAGGFEAERDTWVRVPRRFDEVVEGGREWKVTVAGDARPTMHRLRIEALEGSIDSPFLLSDKNYDFRSVPRLVDSVIRGARTDEQKALAIRELLIGEGFYFHFKPPPMSDPIHRLTNAGYGFCGQHAQIYEELANAAGLRVATCSHPFGYGHASNQVFYDGQWHFIDSNAEGFFRRQDGVIPSYAEVRAAPGLVPPGDAYGQTSFGIDGSRYARALYASDTTCIERAPAAQTAYGELRYPLLAGDRITWEWEDASFSANRVNRLPVFGRGILDMGLHANDFRPVDAGIRVSNGALTLSPAAATGRAQRHIDLAYPPTEVVVTAERAAGIDVRMSKDGGASWVTLAGSQSAAGSAWRATVANPDEWQDPLESAAITKTERLVRAGRYGYVLEVGLTRLNGEAPILRNLRVSTVFRQYPPALPFLKIGDNVLTYVDDGSGRRRARVTLEWEERKRLPGLSTDASAWHWGPIVELSRGGQRRGAAAETAALPTLASGHDGALHAVYAAGAPGARRIALRTYSGGRWSPETVASPPTQDASHPVAADDGGGTIWIAYQVGELWQGADVWLVPVRRGVAAAPIRMNVSDPYHVAFFPSISASESRVTVAWEGGQIDKGANTAWGTEVGWLRSFDGKSWGEPVVVKGEPFTNLGLPKVFYDTRGRLHLTATKGPRYYRTLAPERGAFQWLSPEWVYHSRGGAFAADRRGNVWTAFDGQGSGTTNEIYVRMLPADAASTSIEHWTRAIRISEDDKRPSIYPDVTADDPSHVVLTWMDYRHGAPEVYAKVFARGRWSPDLLLSDAADAAASAAADRLTPNEILNLAARGRHSGYPRAAVAGDGTTWVVWEESIDGVPRAVKARPLTARAPGTQPATASSARR